MIKKPVVLYLKAYDFAVLRTLNLYEAWVLPRHNLRVSLLESKKAEFRERKILMNPILKQSLLEAATDEERHRLVKLEKMTKLHMLEHFNSTYDRHKNLYGYRRSNFPQSYHPETPVLDYAMDLDWSVKYHKQRLRLKRWVLALLMFAAWIKYKTKSVERFDHLKR